MARRLLTQWGMRALATVIVLCGATAAVAAPGDLLPHTGDEAAEPLVVLDAPPEGKSCLKSGAICYAAGARDTIAVEPQAVAVAPGAKASLPVAPRFARAASLAARDTATRATDGKWTIDLSSTLKRASVAGNTIFMLFDLDDPEALPNRQFTALYQANLKAQKTLAARLTLQPSEGFRAGHTYRLRVVQLLGGKEILLAEGDVTIL